MKKVLFLWVILVCLTGVFAMNSCGDSNHVCTLDTNISSSATWIDGNTYVLLSDINVTGSGTVLTISPGAVVKYGPTSLNVLNGGRIVATGTAAKRIYFLSCRDQNVFAGVSNADTSTIPGCSGPPNGADYKHALWIQSDAEMTSGDDLAFLTIGDANQAIQLDLSIGAVHDNNFFNIKQQNPAFTHIGIYTTAGSSAAFYDNVFQNFSTGYGLFLDGGAAASNIFNNRFDNLSGGVGIYLPQNFSGNIYNNLFENPLTISIFNNATFTGTVYNNMFVNLGAGNIAIFNNATFEGLTRRNLFANVSTAFSGVFSGTVSHNAFFNVATHGGSAANHAADQNSATGFTTDPFIADNTDRNFLLNTVSTGGQKLADAGGVDSNSIDLNNFFNLRTTQNGNKLDTNKVDIGYHYDQNAPYVVVRSPSDFNSLTGTQSIDFNVESGFGIASGITAALAYSTTSSGSGTSILSQALSAFACSALPVASCSYAWDTTSVTDGNYFVRLAGTDLNGTDVDYSDANFATVNDSTAPVTSADYNNAWQNVDANVVLTCVDASGCLLTQFRLDSDSSDVVLMGAWQAYDANILVSSDGNWGIDFNSTDTVGNRETTNRIYVRIDKSLPTLSLTVTSVKTVGLSATLSFLGSSESGIKKYWISSDGGTTYSDNGTTETYSFSVSSATQLPHTRRVYIKAMNNADINTAAQSVDVLFEPAGGGSTSVSCGNNICEVFESAVTCPLDCPNVCGDRACTHTENNFLCPFDCAIGCGNGICDAGESKLTCPTDCGPVGGRVVDVNVPSPMGNQNPVTVPLTPQNKACEKDVDCGVSSACSISRCIRNQCYGGQLPEGEPCDVGSVCKAGVCANVSQQLKPVSESDPILWVSISVIVLALGAIGFEYFKK